jgi:hypothetical protein
MWAKKALEEAREKQDILNKEIELSKQDPNKIQTTIAKQAELNNNLKEQAKYRIILGAYQQKDIEKPILEDKIKLLEDVNKKVKELSDSSVTLSSEQKANLEVYKGTAKDLKKEIDELQKKTKSEDFNISLIPKGDNEKLVTFLTQQVNTLKEAKKDFTQEQALLNSILAQDNQTILNGTKTVIKQASDLNSDFGKDLTHIMGTSVTEALSMLNAWQIALQTTQATLSANLDSLVKNNKGNSPEAKALRDEIELYT